MVLAVEGGEKEGKMEEVGGGGKTERLGSNGRETALEGRHGFY